MDDLKKKELVNSGKAKSLYETSDRDMYILHYRNDTSAFDGKKMESLEGKGAINNKFNVIYINDQISIYFMIILKKFNNN